MTGFSWLDYVIFGGYLIGTVLISTIFFKKQRNIKEYLLAGRSMGFIIVAISVIAALFSGISYLGAPSEVYAHDLSFFLIGFAFFISTPITTVVFLPFFYRTKFYTAYQYLEERFSVGVRTLSSLAFVMRVLLWLALAAYAPALALQQVTGMPLWFTIITTGVITTLFTTVGGMTAVIWIDVIQFFVLIGGQIVIFITAIAKTPGGVVGVYQAGLEGGKFTVDFSMDPTVRVTFWGLIIGGAFMNLVQMATDQVSVQRYMTATSLKSSQRSLWLKLALTLPVLVVFYFSGVVLYAFYRSHPDPWALGLINKVDQILPYFVVNELPMGMPGILIAAIFSASMSVISSGINALTTATLVDFYQRLWRPNVEPERQVQLARYLTVAYGGLVILLAFVVQKLGTLLEASNAAIGLVGGPLLGLFLLGMMTKRANAKGAVIGWVAGFAVLIFVAFTTKVSFLWYAMIGCVITMTVGWVTSLLMAPPNPKQLEGLTFDSRYLKEDVSDSA